MMSTVSAAAENTTGGPGILAAVKDVPPIGFFASCKSLLNPSRISNLEYNALWSNADPRIEECVHNSYLLALPSQSSLSVLDRSVDYTSAMSLLDSCRINTLHGVGQRSDELVLYAGGVCYTTLSACRIPKNKTPTLVTRAPISGPTQSQRSSLAVCMMDRRKKEVVSFLACMSRTEYNKAINCASYEVSTKYDLYPFISQYTTLNQRNENVVLDLCDANQGRNSTGATRRTNRQHSEFVSCHPASSVVQVLGRRFSVAV
jgi:hypothetical protein